MVKWLAHLLLTCAFVAAISASKKQPASGDAASSEGKVDWFKLMRKGGVELTTAIVTALPTTLRTAPRDIKALVGYVSFKRELATLSKNEMTVPKLFAKLVQKNANKNILVRVGDGNGQLSKWSVKMVDEFSNKVANVFRELGFKKGDCVSIMMENGPEFVSAWLGLAKLGVISAWINQSLRRSSLIHCIKLSKCSTVIFGSEFVETISDVKDLLPDTNFYVYASRPNDDDQRGDWCHSLNKLVVKAAATPPEIPEQLLRTDDVLAYSFTSGTTNLPKAAVLTHKRFFFMASAIKQMTGLNEKDVIYNPLPLDHTSGGAAGIGQALMYGSTVVMRKKFSASEFFKDIREYECTVAMYVGEMCRYVLATPESNTDKNHKLRMIFGAGLSKHVWEQFVKRFKIPKVAEYYGSAEGNCNIVGVDNRVGSFGFVSRIIPSIYPITVIKVKNMETTQVERNEKGLCALSPPNEPGFLVGKIEDKDPSRQFLGYTDENETKNKIIEDVFQKGDKYFLTGDLVTWDKLGYLYFYDRTGDTFRWKAQNVASLEVENVIKTATKFRDCVVYGVKIRNADGRAGMAAIATAKGSLDLQEVLMALKRNLPEYAVPLFVRLVDHFEKTETCKLVKTKLREEAFDYKLKNIVYYLNKETNRYEELTKEIYERIQNGDLKF